MTWGAKAIQEKFGGKIETSFVERARERRRERVMRDIAGQNSYDLATSFSQEFVSKVAADLPDVKFETRHRLQTAANVACLRPPAGLRCVSWPASSPAVRARPKTVAWWHPRSIPGWCATSTVLCWAQSVDPSIKAKVVWVSEMVQPAEGGRGRHQPDQRRRGRDVPEHFARGAPRPPRSAACAALARTAT